VECSAHRRHRVHQLHPAARAGERGMDVTAFFGGW
jgi:hypothetical protein